MKKIFILLIALLSLLACSKSSSDSKFCTIVISSKFGSSIGYRLVIKDRIGNEMEIVVTQTDFNIYQNPGTSICVDKNYNIWRG